MKMRLNPNFENAALNLLLMSEEVLKYQRKERTTIPNSFGLKLPELSFSLSSKVKKEYYTNCLFRNTSSLLFKIFIILLY